jgi:hypothetical protein
VGLDKYIIICSKLRANNYTKSAFWVSFAFSEAKKED